MTADSSDQPWRNESRMRELFCEDGYSKAEMAEQFGCVPETVCRWLKRYDLLDTEQCPTCGGDYEQPGTHWALSECPYPSLTDAQHEVVTGLVMGDGYIKRRPDAHPALRVTSIQRDFLKHLMDLFGPIGSTIRLRMTAEESRDHIAKSFGRPKSDGKYHDLYRAVFRANPAFDQYASWYDSGSIQFPDDLNFTEQTLRYYYVCDGTIENHDRPPRIRITTVKQASKVDWLCELCSEIGYEATPVTESRWGRDTANVCLTTDATRKFLDNTDPVPGFGYKWLKGHYDG